MRSWQQSRTDPFTDLLFNALLGFTFLFLVAIMYMNPEEKTGIIDPKAEYILTVTWPDFSEDDIDTWVEDPEGRLVWFRNTEAGLLHLDRDDRGMINDTLRIEGREVQNPLNQEVLTIRGVQQGEYVVNLHYYASLSEEPVPVNYRLVRVNPRLEVLYYGETTLEKQGDEVTVLRFRIGHDGNISSLNRLPKSLVIMS